MKLLYSNILPLGTEDNQETISDRFLKEISSSDVVEIAVGYVSKAALQELEQMVDTQKIRRIVLTIGMYFVEGMPESIYHTAIALNRKWGRCRHRRDSDRQGLQVPWQALCFL